MTTARLIAAIVAPLLLMAALAYADGCATTGCGP